MKGCWNSGNPRKDPSSPSPQLRQPLGLLATNPLNIHLGPTLVGWAIGPPYTRASRGCWTMQPCITVAGTVPKRICLSHIEVDLIAKHQRVCKDQAHRHYCIDPADAGQPVEVGPKEELRLKRVLKGLCCRRARVCIPAAALVPTSEIAPHVGMHIMHSNRTWTVQAVTILPWIVLLSPSMTIAGIRPSRP